MCLCVRVFFFYFLSILKSSISCIALVCVGFLPAIPCSLFSILFLIQLAYIHNYLVYRFHPPPSSVRFVTTSPLGGSVARPYATLLMYGIINFNLFISFDQFYLVHLHDIKNRSTQNTCFRLEAIQPIMYACVFVSLVFFCIAADSTGAGTYNNIF